MNSENTVAFGVAVLTCTCALSLIGLIGSVRIAASELVRLSSGKEVEIVRVAQTGDAVTRKVMTVEYITGIQTGDFVTLSPEAEEVWSHYRQRADASDVATMIVSACDKSACESRTSFGFLRDDGDVWRKPKLRALPSGKPVLIVGIREPDVDGRERDATFSVTYVTYLSIGSADYCELANEANEVWTVFQNQAQDAGARRGIVRLTDVPFEGDLTGFVFDLTPEHYWRRRGRSCEQN